MMTIPFHLYADLIGRPFVHGGRGPVTFDCVGLACEMQRRRGLVLPAYLSDEAELHRQVAVGGALDEMHLLDKPEPWAVVLMRSPGTAKRHIGTMLGRFQMIHASEDSRTVVIESLLHSVWGRCVLGYYRVGE